MRGHRWIDHTADMAFEVWAEDFGGLLAEGTRALGRLLRAAEEGETLEDRSLAVEGGDREDVLVAWLGEAVVLFETEGWLVRDARVDRADGQGARGVLRGRTLVAGEDPDRVVKAVTYHDLAIEEGDGDRPWRATVVLDL
jgi:SHS2 domain-containing protein